MVASFADLEKRRRRRFRSCYSGYRKKKKHPRFTNFTEQVTLFNEVLNVKFQGTLDYILYSEDPRLAVSMLLALPAEELITAERALPSSIFPSDHLPIMATFRYLLDRS